MSKNIHILHVSTITHTDSGGNILWKKEGLRNILHDEGEIALLSAYFATSMSGYGAPPPTLYLGLDARTSVLESNTLSSITGEPLTSNGYVRGSLSTSGGGGLADDFYIVQPLSFYRAESKTIIFSCTNNPWSPVTRLFLGTASSGTSGKLLCTVDLSASRSLQVGDSLTASIYIGLSE